MTKRQYKETKYLLSGENKEILLKSIKEAKIMNKTDIDNLINNELEKYTKQNNDHTEFCFSITHIEKEKTDVKYDIFDIDIEDLNESRLNAEIENSLRNISDEIGTKNTFKCEDTKEIKNRIKKDCEVIQIQTEKGMNVSFIYYLTENKKSIMFVLEVIIKNN